jgi:hypothetical protein
MIPAMCGLMKKKPKKAQDLRTLSIEQLAEVFESIKRRSLSLMAEADNLTSELERRGIVSPEPKIAEQFLH